jgi:hypothetical protein
LQAPGSQLDDGRCLGVTNGQRGSTEQAAIYTTPSIKYASKPSYSRVLKYQEHFYQVVLQVRQRPGSYRVQRGAVPPSRYQFDPQFTNDELERLNTQSRDVCLSRLLVRETSIHTDRLWPQPPI